MADKSLGKAFSLFHTEEQPPVVLLALLPDDESPLVDEVFASVERQFEQELLGFEVNEISVPKASWEVEMRVNTGAVYIIWSGEIDKEQMKATNFRSITGDELSVAQKSTKVIGLATLMKENPLQQLQRCYRLLTVAAPKATAFADVGARVARGKRWVDDMAFSCALPSISLAYSIQQEGLDERSLLCTMGLRRFSLPEIEIHDVPQEAEEDCFNLIERSARRFIDLGLPPEDEPFSIGKGLELIWLDRQSLQEDWAAKLRQGPLDVPAVVLFSSVGGPSWRRLENPAASPECLNASFFVPKGEVQSRRLIAYERFQRFRTLFRLYNQREEWNFYAFVGLVDEGPIDEAEKFSWLQVEKITERGFLARQVKNPEERRTAESKLCHYELHFMVDWLIDSPQGFFGAEEVAVLEGLLEETSPGKKRN